MLFLLQITKQFPVKPEWFTADIIKRTKNLPIQNYLSHKSTGQFDFNQWIKEGDGFLVSSRKVRDTWKNHRERFFKTIKNESRPNPEDWALLQGLPRVSMLLLGYAVENYLKAGLAKAYRGCANKMFERDVKSRFGHKLKDMADELEFPFPGQTNDRQKFKKLENMILFDARYPVFVSKDESYCDASNQQISRIWPEKEYEDLYSIGERVRKHACRIDSDSSNCTYFTRLTIDNDGYLVFRVGGHLPPRITYRVSTEMHEENHKDVSDVKALLDEGVHRQNRILQHWDQAWIYEDGENKTSRRQQPPSNLMAPLSEQSLPTLPASPEPEPKKVQKKPTPSSASST